MSLAAMVLRHLTVLALTDQTLAGKEVRSSLLEPLNEISAMPVPVIAIFTDIADADRQDVHGLDLIGADITVTLALETACFARPPEKDAAEADLMIPYTDEGLEMTLDILQRQALATLQCGGGSLSELWREVAMRSVGMSAMRGASIEKGTRIAARRLEIKLRPISDPIPGMPLPETWERVFTAFEADQRTVNFVPLLRSIAAGEPATDWEQTQRALGLTLGAVRALGIVPLDDQVPEEVTQLAGDDADTGQSIVVTSDGAILVGSDQNETSLVEP